MIESTGFDLSDYFEKCGQVNTTPKQGKITELIGNVIKAYNPGMNIGDVCQIKNPQSKMAMEGEAVGFKDDKIFIMPLGDLKSIGPQSRIIPSGENAFVHVGDELLGRVIDGKGDPIDRKEPIICTHKASLYSSAINPLERNVIREPLDIGIRCINGLMTLGKGQRIGILAGSGVGKSVLLAMMASETDADIIVIAMIGERGREVKEFIEYELGEEALKKSIIIAATSDQSPLLRMRGAFMATSIAEYFRDQGKDVLLLMDSVTRFAMAQREIGLSAGETPTSKGYPTSVYSLLPKLLERAGNLHDGSITGIYTVLVEGDDPNEPIGDAVRSIVDGHLVLDRSIAARNHYPAIDVLLSKSRVMNNVTNQAHQDNAGLMLKLIAAHREAEDLINIGAYVRGSNPITDYAIQKMPEINQFLVQKKEEQNTIAETEVQLNTIFQDKPAHL